MRTGRAITMALGLAVLAGCNAEERGHVVRLDKGEYKGMADTAIPDSTRDALRQRIAWQSEGPAKVAVSAGIAVMPSGEAKPSGRIAGQKF